MPDAGAILRVRSLGVAFASRGPLWRRHPAHVAVRDISFDLHASRTLGLVGESGSGKSTVARAILGLVPFTGEILLDGSPVVPGVGSSRRALRDAVQAVFQDPGGSLNPRQRVRDAVAEPLVVRGTPLSRAVRSANELLARCGIDPAQGGLYPHQFSGGQRQRIAIARALAPSPRVLICDEPTSALDVSVQAQILNLLVELQRDAGVAILLITHDLGVVRHMADDIGVLRTGSMVELGPRERVLHEPASEYTRALLAESPDPHAAWALESSAS
ncbi:MAG: ATP-binding cassette domain-containing protein [Planctomycetota bacterium]|nr:ATP-binding cassette domain-containing protein [Planctomycetota bacterium]